jgi:sugar phosphate isomerase/epimerase
MADLSRLSLNQITVEGWDVREAVEGCLRYGIPSIALWRHKIQEFGLAEAVRVVKTSGLHVSSVCRGGMFPAATSAERKAKIEDNCRAIDEAAELQADSLVMVVGASEDVSLTDARQMVVDGLAAIVPYARERGVRIGLEPLHPMYAAERSVLNTVEQALEMASPYTVDEVGVVLDTFHIWWDPRVLDHIAAARGRICGFHVSDWLVPLPDMLMGRGMMGDGVIDNRMLREAVDAADYSGPIEVEIFNRAIWDTPGDEVLELIIDRFTSLV